MSDHSSLLGHCPTLKAFIERIGAREVNFRRFEVRLDVQNYYIEKLVVSVGGDGQLKLIGPGAKEAEPTKEERERIKEEVAAAPPMPHSTLATRREVKALLASGRITGKLYTFWSLDRKSVIMCQERRELPEGRKAYLPWTLYGREWQMMEPEAKLPFWKPEKRTTRSRLMIHEGAKTAETVTRLLEEGGHFPPEWAEYLNEYEHWGIIGGALAPHRADYAEVWQEKPAEVVYVTDHDFEGEEAVKVVSRCYGGAMKQIKWGDDFPQKWDMADPLPRSIFKKNGDVNLNYQDLGRMADCATWATEVVPIPGTKRSVVKISNPFAQEWRHCAEPEVAVWMGRPDRLVKASVLNGQRKPFSDSEETFRLLRDSSSGKAEVIKYDPARKPGEFFSNGVACINTHVPGSVREEAGDPGPWLAYLENMVEDVRDRLELARWVATLIDRPDIDMDYGVLLISETQGVGKTTLGQRILTPLLGKDNVSSPAERDIVDSRFNGWAAHKRLAVVNEIYQGHSWKAYNMLKSMITDQTITVERKYQDTYMIENHIHILACSNNKRALKIDDDDRRWFIPELREKTMPEEYWNEFFDWLEDGPGLGIIKRWAREFLIKHDPVASGAAAPGSRAKLEVIEGGYGSELAMIKEFLEEARERCNGKAFLTTDGELLELVKVYLCSGQAEKLKESRLGVRKLARVMGLHVGKGKVYSSELRIAKNSRLISSDEHLATKDAAGLSLVDRSGIVRLVPLVEVKVWGLFQEV